MGSELPPEREQPSRTLTAGEMISLLDLKAHPEGGYFRETFRDERTLPDGRNASTAIYFLLPAGRVSHWHRIDGVEIWHHYAGAALELSISDGERIETLLLGPDIVNGEQPQGIVPPSAWQSARTLGEWSLVGCTCAPGFEFDHFELAPAGWSPGR